MIISEIKGVPVNEEWTSFNKHRKAGFNFAAGETSSALRFSPTERRVESCFGFAKRAQGVFFFEPTLLVRTFALS